MNVQKLIVIGFACAVFSTGCSVFAGKGYKWKEDEKSVQLYFLTDKPEKVFKGLESLADSINASVSGSLWSDGKTSGSVLRTVRDKRQNVFSMAFVNETRISVVIWLLMDKPLPQDRVALTISEDSKSPQLTAEFADKLIKKLGAKKHESGTYYVIP